MSSANELLLLIHIYVLGIPMMGASLFLFFLTVRIRGLLERYRVETTVFRGILSIGYLFIFIAVMHLAEEVFEWYEYETVALEVGALWHGATVVVLLIVAYSFYQYFRLLKVEK